MGSFQCPEILVLSAGDTLVYGSAAAAGNHSGAAAGSISAVAARAESGGAYTGSGRWSGGGCLVVCLVSWHTGTCVHVYMCRCLIARLLCSYSPWRPRQLGSTAYWRLEAFFF